MKKRRAVQKPVLEESRRVDVVKAISRIESLDWVMSEAEVACDHLAGKLRAAYFSQDPHFAGKSPSLYDVIQRLHDVYRLPEKALDAAEALKSRLEDSYRSDNTGEIIEEVKESADVLVAALTEFLESR
jgi:hypothetical protein